MGVPSPEHLRPHDAVTIDLNCSQDDIDSAVKALCRRVLPGWAEVKDADLQISTITGGITNKLFKVTPSASTPGIPPVAVKVFGAYTEVLVDRESEVKNLLLLNEYGFGAQILALFNNGRIEEFLVARTLEPPEMADPAYVPRIARLLRLMHGVGSSSTNTSASPDGAPAPAGGGGDSSSAADGVSPDQAATTPVGGDGGGGDGCASTLAAAMDRSDRLWPTLWTWLDIAKTLTFEKDQNKAKRFAAIDLAVIEREMRELQAACEATRSPTVFAHNDLLSGNILIVKGGRKAGVFQPCSQSQAGATAGAAAAAKDAASATTTTTSGAGGAAGADSEEDGEMQFIDFEYSNFTARGFDFGNHFNEYAGFECDHSRYPSQEAQRTFLRHYVAAVFPGSSSSGGGGSSARSAPSTGHQRSPTEGQAVAPHATSSAGATGEAAGTSSDAEVDQLLGETAVYSLASHVFWAVWALIQARYSPIDFDYMGFFDGRWGEYLKRKDERMALATRLCRS